MSVEKPGSVGVEAVVAYLYAVDNRRNCHGEADM